MTDSELTGVSEYVSRWARWRLVGACVEGFRERMKSEDGRVHGDVIEEFAGLVGVSGRTVQRWLANGVQSCNDNAERIVELAVEMIPVETGRILREDLDRHRVGVDSVLEEGCHGVVAAVVEVDSR